MSTPSRSARCPRLAARPHVEADHERVRRGCEVDVVLGDAADPGVDHVDPHLGVLDLPELAQERLDRALHVALETMLSSWTPPSCICSNSVSSETPCFERCASCSRRSRSERFSARSFACRSCSTTRASSPARGGLVEAEDLDRLAGLRLLHLLAAVVLSARAPCRRRRRRRSRRRRAACRAARASSRPGRDRRRGVTRRSAPTPRPSGSRAGRARRPRRAESSRGARRGSSAASRTPRRTASCRPSPPAAAPRRRARSSPGRCSRQARRSC